MARRIVTIDRSVIVYDDALVSQMRAELFDPASWPDAPAAPGYSGGRGQTLFIEHDEQSWVLRHYHRGGYVGRVLSDRFIRVPRDRTRPFREWQLLEHLQRTGLPAPRPVAARYVRHGLRYTADLITELIPDVVPFSTRLASGDVSDDVWRQIGTCVARFHCAHIFHADLTAHNLQVDSRDRVYLLDFDRGRVMSRPGIWRERNMDRLHRSLRKITREGVPGFSEHEWKLIEQAYRSVRRDA